MPLGDGIGWNIAAPADTDQRSVGAAEIRDLRTGVGIRIDKEHAALAAASAGGEHSTGSAKAYYDDTSPLVEPTLRPDGSTALTTADNGRLAMLDTGLYYFTDATGVVGNKWRFITPFMGSVALPDAANTDTALQTIGYPFRVIAFTTSDGFQGLIVTQAGYGDQTDAVVCARLGGADTFTFTFVQDDYDGQTDGTYTFVVQKSYISSSATFLYAVLG